MKASRRPVFCRIAVLFAAALLLGVDQLIKHFVLLRLAPVGEVTVIGGLLEFSYTENTGAAFGLFKNNMVFITLLGTVIFLLILVLLFRYSEHTVFSLVSAALLLAGGLGNIIDRVRYGFVVDFIHVLFFPYIFNFADCCITVGAVLFVIHFLLLSRREKREKEMGE